MKLFTFGCSNTAPYHELTKGYRDYKNFRNGEFPPTWPELLSKKLCYELINYGLPGTGNDSIFYEFCKHINEINKNDLVIIGWTFNTRYMWPDKKSKKWEHLTGEYDSSVDLTSSTHSEIIINRMDKDVIRLLTDQIYSWIDLINKVAESVGFTVKYWSSDGDIIYPDHNGFPCQGLTIKNVLVHHYIFDLVKMLDGERIIEETKGEVDDAHWGQSGHEKVCEIFYRHIKNNLNFTKTLI
jgi:hypothetical protein